MTVDSIGAASSSQSSSSSSTATSTTTTPSGGLGRDAFMQLLVTQLKNQDPTQPQDSSQFVAELAQFSSLEKLTSIDQSTAKLNDISQFFTGLASAATTGSTSKS